MTLAHTNEVLAAVLAVAGLMGLVLGYLRWMRPRVGRILAVWTALVELLFGRPEEPENPITGAAPVPAVLGIGPRIAMQEQAQVEQGKQLAILTEAVAKLVDNEHRLTQLEGRVSVLEDARVEQVVTKAESAAMWSAIAHEQQEQHHADQGGEPPLPNGDPKP